MSVTVQIVPEKKPRKPRPRFDPIFRDVEWTSCAPRPVGGVFIVATGVVTWPTMTKDEQHIIDVPAECVKISDGRRMLTAAGAAAIKAAAE